MLHDVNLALRCCDRLLLLPGDGRRESGLMADLATAERLSAPNQCPLAAIDHHDRPGRMTTHQRLHRTSSCIFALAYAVVAMR